MAKKKETRPAIRKFTGSTTEKLEAFLKQKPGIVLSDLEEYILERYETAISIMTKDRFGYPNTEAETAKKLQEIYGLSMVQARQDLNEAQKLFGNVFTVRRAVKQKQALDMAVEAIRWALEEKDLEQYIKAVNLYTKIVAGLPENADNEAKQITNVLIINTSTGNRQAVDMNKIHELKQEDFQIIADTIHKEGLSSISIDDILEAEEEEDENI